MKRYLSFLFALALVGAVGCEAMHHDDDDDDDGAEVSVPLAQVPAPAVTAAKKAVPGIEFKEAEKEVENGVTVYCLAGMAKGMAYEVEVTAEGKVLEIEKGEDGDKDDDRDDDDDRK